jgi:hypothetical protein
VKSTCTIIPQRAYLETQPTDKLAFGAKRAGRLFYGILSAKGYVVWQDGQKKRAGLHASCVQPALLVA